MPPPQRPVSSTSLHLSSPLLSSQKPTTSTATRRGTAVTSPAPRDQHKSSLELSPQLDFSLVDPASASAREPAPHNTTPSNCTLHPSSARDSRTPRHISRPQHASRHSRLVSLSPGATAVYRAGRQTSARTPGTDTTTSFLAAVYGPAPFHNLRFHLKALHFAQHGRQPGPRGHALAWYVLPAMSRDSGQRIRLLIDFQTPRSVPPPSSSLHRPLRQTS